MSQDVETRNEQYADYVKKMALPSKYFPSLIWAFLIGGLITILGQSFYLLYETVTDLSPEMIGALVAVTLIGIAAFLTAIGVYDRIGAFSGGGSIVPITGFSNAVSASAIEHRKEGIIFGTCTNMFKIAGPVIVVGVALSWLVGFIYFIIGLFGG
ncbi:MAG: SpoVA/SpoVAEb family sporulation membrane protein [Firmicutes bacterium]|nr:SpoVA/SpoVAEb family sporulation membrane protein [Bacillota bacterium]